ncbi:MAG: peptidoglycan-associated lipoprotein Pal [Thermodesulfobacteriota bacterium]
MALLIAAVAATGCTKKAVKSDAASGAPVAAAPAPMEAAPAAPAPAPAPTVVAAKPAEAAPGVAVTEEKPSSFADVLFDFDKSDLREDGKKTSQEVAAFMKKNPGAKLLVEGHCDERGTAEYNMALGDRRAASVKNYIVSLGVPAAAVSTVSFGKERPLDPAHTEDAWAKNRRAHFVVK